MLFYCSKQFDLIDIHRVLFVLSGKVYSAKLNLGVSVADDGLCIIHSEEFLCRTDLNLK